VLPERLRYECASRLLHGAVVGAGAAVLIGGLSLAGHRFGRIPPTLTCRRCGTSGWVLDIEPHGGRCPRCGADRFDYRIWFGGGNRLGPRLIRLREYDVAGAMLVQRFQETHGNWMRRYY
jgi:rubredoxin